MEERATPAVTTRSVGTRYGVVMAAISVVIFLAFSLSNMDMSSGIGRWATLPIYLVVIYIAQKNFMDNGDSYMSYGQGMGITFWIGLISSVIYSAFFYVYVKFIDGSFIEKIKQMQMEKMQDSGMPDDQIDQAMGIASAFMSPEIMAFFGLVGGIISIVICGLILTAFTQKGDRGLN